MQRVGEHRVPAGPLAVRWLAHDVVSLRAGRRHVFRVHLRNEGLAPWRDLKLSYHWLDDRRNAIVWDGLRSELPPLRPGEEVTAECAVRGPIPPGRYRLALDLVVERRYWLAELGNVPLELDLPVEPRIERRLAVVGAQVAGQEEPLVPPEDAEAVGYLAPACEPAPDWSRRVLDAHQQGYGVVGGAIVGGGSAFAPWTGGGRNPAFEHPLLCPSLVRGLEPEWLDAVEGLPAVETWGDEPWIYDGRIRVRLRSGRRPG